MAAEFPTPPVPVVRTVEWLRNLLARIHRKTVPAPIALMEMVQASMLAQAVYAAAELGIADALADRPLSIEDLAAKVEANPDALQRLLRPLRSAGIFRRRPDGTYQLTPLAQPLRADADVSMRDPIRFLLGAVERNHWSHLPDAVRTGEAVVPALDGMPFFEFTSANEEYGQLFHSAMTSTSALALAPTLATYDFSRYRTIVDVAGGHGSLLAELLNRNPDSRGVLFDLPEVVKDAEELLRDKGVGDRCRVEGGSFFDTVPEGGDAYVLKHIVHDWPEEQAEQILRTVRRAMTDDARLLLIEIVLPEDSRPTFGNLLDLQMLLSVGGRERTEREYRELLARCGFELVRRVGTVTLDSVLEFKPVT
ncbi:MAG: hydroxyneurosporene methyltransferase [Mycobacteriaceae bacterium]|nr:hydroxyneurosporene methyltransferase [Mycobacteriaceae bacterium]